MIPEMRSSAHFRSCTGGVGSVALAKFATGRLVSTATHDEAALPERRQLPRAAFSLVARSRRGNGPETQGSQAVSSNRWQVSPPSTPAHNPYRKAPCYDQTQPITEGYGNDTRPTAPQAIPKCPHGAHRDHPRASAGTDVSRQRPGAGPRRHACWSLKDAPPLPQLPGRPLLSPPTLEVSP